MFDRKNFSTRWCVSGNKHFNHRECRLGLRRIECWSWQQLPLHAAMAVAPAAPTDAVHAGEQHLVFL
jgi:hypothetical protein